MIGHYLITALRNFQRHKVATGMNLICLAIGIAGFLGAHWVVTSMDSADLYFPNADRIVEITQKVTIPGSELSGTLAYTAWQTRKYLRNDFPQLTVARATMPESIPVLVGDTKTFMQGRYADPEFFDIFAVPIIVGDPKRALSQPHSVVLTADAAQRLFGNSAAALGRRLILSGSIDGEVTAVIGNIRRPSHMQAGAQLGFDMLISIDVAEQDALKRQARDNWTAATVPTYVLLPAGSTLTQNMFVKALATFGKRNVPADICQCEFGAKPANELALTELNSVVGTDRTGVTARSLLYMFGGLMLFIACLNYANLATAQYAARAKEVGMRRVVGASGGQVMTQYLFEAALLSGVAMLLVIVVFGLAVTVSKGAETTFVLQRMLTSGRSWTGAILLLCVITLAAGFYPAFFLSKVRPIAAVRAGQARAPSRWVSSVLVGTQFASASFLLIAVLVTSAHNTHMKHMALGAQSEVLVVLKNNVGVSQVNMDSLRTELLRQPNVKAVTSYHVVPWGYATGILRIARSAEDTGRARLSATNLVEHDFFSTLNMKLLAGRIFDREHATDVTLWKAQSPASVVIDRALAEQQGWIDPQQAIGKTLYLRGAALNRGVLPRPLNIIGVVEGKALGVLGLGATSNVYFLAPASAAYPIIKISASDVAATLASIDSTWARLAPNVAVDRKLSGELLDSTYAIFERVTRAITALSLLAVLSALFGLIGMSIHIVGRRTHEIGVRKTLGASVGRITWLLLKDFSKPVIIANVIAWPLAFVAMRLYLSIFVDHAALSFVPFVSSIVVTLLIAWLAVAAQTIRAARVKPAAVLRYE